MDDSEKRINSHLDSIVGIMAHEGIDLTDDVIEQCRAVLSGEADADEIVKQIIEECRAKNGLSNSSD